MDLIGLVNSISNAATNIDSGRKGFAVMGKERAGRIAYERGIADALSAFKQAQTSADPQTIILAKSARFKPYYSAKRLCQKAK